jgi:S-adenosylmethionine decarboxylase
LSIGVHLVADLRGVSASKISKLPLMKEIMESAVKSGGLTKIRSHYHQFSPTGVSGVILLAESHLSFHTWPEYGFVALDIFTCGPTENAEAAFEYIIDKLSPVSVEYKKIERGAEFPRGVQKDKSQAAAAIS